eukprot:7389013-Prymnesium_polylepis.2
MCMCVERGRAGSVDHFDEGVGEHVHVLSSAGEPSRRCGRRACAPYHLECCVSSAGEPDLCMDHVDDVV